MRIGIETSPSEPKKGVRTTLLPNTPAHFGGYIYKERERVTLHSSQNELHALALFPLPKMSCMLLFFPPSQRELYNSVAVPQT
jgi:hypothetical protein